MTEISPRQQEVIEAVNQFGSYRKAAAALGVSEGTVNQAMSRAIGKGHVGQRTEIFVPLAPKHVAASRETIKVCAIGDYHDSPGQPKDRIKWIARWIEDEQPDYVVQIGDFADFDSLSAHAKPGTIDHMERPSFRDDLESLEEVFHLYQKILGDDGPQKFLTLGNHEHRAERFDKQTPERRGLGCKDELDQLLARYRWRTTEFGQWLYLNQVGFIHIPMNLMGKEYRGRTINPMANDAITSMVFGDNHRKSYLDQPKIGHGNSVTLIGLGTAMPEGHIKPYAQRSMTGWGYGVWALSIRAGAIPDHSYVSMKSLEDRYGD